MPLEISDATDLKSGWRRLLLWGPQKRKKTRLLLTAPKPVRVYDFDNGALSLAAEAKPGEIQVVRFREAKADKIGHSQKRPTQKDLFDAFITDFNSLYDLPAKDLPATICYDSLTSLSDIVLEYVLAMNGRNDPQFQDWGQAIVKIEESIQSACSLAANFILIAHEQVQRDELTGSIRNDPMTIGKLSQKIAMYFDEVMYTDVVSVNNKNEVKLLTEPTGIVKTAGSRTRLLEKHIDPTWTAIFGPGVGLKNKP
jgi:hypothetical protein